ncbi:MAG: HAD family phosphatase [Blautia sp.]|nr:HAD family phosphatase [Blautia sp.]
MDKMKRILAILGVVLLLAVFCLPLVYSGGTGEGAQGRFLGAAAAAVFIPMLVYVLMMAFKVFGPKTPAAGSIRNIVFDVGNVLIGFEWPEYLDSFGFSPEKREKIADATFRSPVWNERDRGSKAEEEYVQEFVNAAPEYEEDIREILRRSPECIRPYDYSESWVRYLADRGYRIFILSNYSRYMLDINRKDMTFLKYADGAIFSCEEKLIKPEDAIYRLLLDRYGLDPAETVFMDDNPTNVEAAVRNGMKGIVFRSLDATVSELEKLGVK